MSRGARILGAVLWALIILAGVWWCVPVAHAQSGKLCYAPVAGSSSCQPVSPTTPYPVKPFGIPTVAAPSYSEGVPSPFSFDLNGNLRVSATVVPAGTQNVNLTQILSAAPSLINPLWVTPATGATFVVNGGGAAGTANAGVVTVQGIVGMTKLLVTPDSVALPANQSVNISQINAVTPLMGNGATGTGAMRVSIANDSTGIVALPAAGTSVVGTKAAGTAAATSVLEGAVYNSTVPTLTDGQQAAAQADTTGARKVNTEGLKTTYSAATSPTAASGTTDICTLTGSGTKTIRVTHVQISGVATATTVVGVLLNKYSTALTGGTPASATIVPYDSANAAGTALAQSWSANPTGGGSLVGTMHRGQFIATGTGLVTPLEYSVDFGARNQQTVVLRGTSQVLSVNLGGITIAGLILRCTFEWTEE